MKTIKKTNAFIAALLFTTTFNTYSMKNKPIFPTWATIVGSVLLGAVAIKMLWQSEPSEPFEFITLPPEMQDRIIQLLSLNTTASTFKEAAFTINSLAQVNHELNELINDPQCCLKLIKSLAKKFNCSHEKVCQTLQTKEAKRLWEVQSILYDLLVTTFDESGFFPLPKPLHIKGFNIELLCNLGADLEFIYDGPIEEVTPLMLASINEVESYNISSLLAKGANINTTNKNGKTALMLAAQSRNFDAINRLCKSITLDINKQDHQGNTALMLSLTQSPYANNINYMTVRRLLEADANPIIGNFNGLTPLAAAQETNNQEIINLIQEAINKNS